RRRLALLAIIAVTPLLYFMLTKNGASLTYTTLLMIIVLIGLAIQLDVGVLGVIPRLRADIGVIQRIDLIGAILRLTILVFLAFIFLNAGRNRPQDNSDLQRKDKCDRRAPSPGVRSVRRPDASCEICIW